MILEQLQVIQSTAAHAVDELIAFSVPDRRGCKRGVDIRQKLLAWSPNYPGLDVILRGLDEQLDRLEECGLPSTLVASKLQPSCGCGEMTLETSVEN